MNKSKMNKIKYLISALSIAMSLPLGATETEPTADKIALDSSTVEPKRDQQVKIKTETSSAAAQLLAGILANTLTYKAHFKQSVYRENSDQPETTSGTFLIQRPNHFRWETMEPFEQVIVADGTTLWTYDPELEQASIQNQHAVLADSPLLLLTSSVDALVDAFDIIEVEGKDVGSANDTQHLFSLTPLKSGLFETVHILIKNNKIKEFFLTDTLGGRTSVEFSEIELNQTIDLKDFIFVPPEDIDIIDSRERISD